MKINKASVLLSLLLAMSACESEVTLEASNHALDDVKPQQQDNTLYTLFDAKNEEHRARLSLNSADSKINTDNNLSVTFNSQEQKYSNIVFSAEQPWDWSSFDDFNLAFDIANDGQHSVQLYLDIADIDGANYTRTVNIPQGSDNTYYAKMAGHDLATANGDGKVELNFVSGLRSNPDTWSSDEVQFTSMWGKKNLNTKGIVSITLSVQSALFDKKIIINNIRLRQNPAMNPNYLTGIVDKFGQNATMDFPDKIHTNKELLARRDAELKQLDGKWHTPRSKWGGWANGPKLEGTGYFRTAKHKGKWSLVDPDGYLYFATGLDIIRLANSTTMTGYDFPEDKLQKRAEGDVTPEDSQGLNRVSETAIPHRLVASQVRQKLFTWLPEYDEPLGKHYGYRVSAHSGPLPRGETYSFYSANLERRYADISDDFMQKWRDVTLDRMKNWGFTSLGNWTDPSFYSNQEVPFFANGWIIGDYKTVSSGNDFWAALPDVFDPKFEERALYTASVIANEVQKTPWCVGIFVDNEKSFGRSETNESRYGIVINTLTRSGADVPTKAVFTKMMVDKYSSIEKLNKAWDKSITSWQAFDKGIDSVILTDAQLQDYSDMLFAYADKYFSTVDKALDKYLPNHMYLGSRFPDWGMPEEVVKASTKYVDVVSYNVYKEGLHPQTWDFLEDLDMPSIIGEFHVGAKDSGLFHPGLIHAANQKDRAKIYSDYMHSIIDNPYFIGAHWFQYMDSPITGRAYDGENYNVGFVGVTDTPYTEMVEAAKKVHLNMYERRFNGK